MTVLQVRQFDVTVPVGTVQTSPQKTPLALADDFEVKWVEVQVPTGTRGQVGFYLASSGTPVIPYGVGTETPWMRLDGITLRYDIDPKLNAGDWSLIAYNIGNFPHEMWLRFGVTLAPAPAPGMNTVPIIEPLSLAGTLV